MQKIAIHSVPRSGSTWLGNIFNSHPKVSFKLQPLFSYAFKDYLTSNSSKEEIEIFFKLIDKSEDNFINQREGIEKRIIPKFKKKDKLTHCCYKEVRYHHILENMISKSKEVKIILLIRNPLAVLYSWNNAPKEFRVNEGWLFEEEWLNAPKKNLNKIEEYNGYAKWKEATYVFLKLKELYPNNVMLMTYSQLIKDTKNQIKKVFDFCNLEFVSETMDFIKLSKSTNHENPYSVFKQKKIDESWKNLPKIIIEYIIKDLKNTKLEKYLYE